MSTEIVERPKTVLDEVVALAELAPKDYVTQEHLYRLEGIKKALLPVEEKAAEELDQRIAEVKRDLFHKTNHYAKLSLEPLEWRHKNGLPKLVPMSLGAPSFTITGWRNNDVPLSTITPQGMPKEIAAYFYDVCRKAESLCYRRNSKVVYSFQFEGMIPDATRMAIAEATTHFQSIYMLVETPEKAWTIERTKGLTRRQEFREALANIQLDPIVVGYKNESFWVIDKFDLTNVEQYVLDEFSQLALTPGE